MPVAGGLSYAHHGGGPMAMGRPPLVLIHGAGGSRLDWPPSLRRLPAWTVYAIDLPGHGASRGPGQSTILGYRQAIEVWMRELGLPPAIVVGHSMGGAVALSLALASPACVDSLVLVGTGGRLRVHPLLLEATRPGGTAGEVLSGLIPSWYSPGVAPRMLELAARRLEAVDSAVLHGDFQACDAFDVMDRLSSIGQPALIVVGEEDAMTPVKYARYLADHLADARLAIVPAAGHMVMLEQPRALEAVLNDWLATRFPPG
jgi:pimeloyl-ACP methyl ester carboxylesterase